MTPGVGPRGSRFRLGQAAEGEPSPCQVRSLWRRQQGFSKENNKTVSMVPSGLKATNRRKAVISDFNLIQAAGGRQWEGGREWEGGGHVKILIYKWNGRSFTSRHKETFLSVECSASPHSRTHTRTHVRTHKRTHTHTCTHIRKHKCTHTYTRTHTELPPSPCHQTGQIWPLYLKSLGEQIIHVFRRSKKCPPPSPFPLFLQTGEI